MNSFKKCGNKAVIIALAAVLILTFLLPSIGKIPFANASTGAAPTMLLN